MSNETVNQPSWIPVEKEMPPDDGTVIDVFVGDNYRLTSVVWLDDWIYFKDALYHDPNGDMPDPIELCHIKEVTHWAKIVLPNI